MTVSVDLEKTGTYSTLQLADYTALRAYTGSAKQLSVTGYLVSAAPSATAGLFTRDDNDTTSADDGGTIIVAGNGKRWKRVYDGALSLRWFLTPAQFTAMQTNAYTGVDSTTFTAAVQAAIDAAHGHILEIPAPAFIKVNRPLVWTANTAIEGLGVPNLDLGVVFYPDLSVDWPTLYPDQGVLTADKYLFGYAGHGSVTAGFWTGIGKNFQVRADLDAANYAANRARVPDYGIVIWCANESVLMEHVQVLRFKKHNWLVGGVSSVPTFLHCFGMHAGDGQDTTLGDAVTRAAAPFVGGVSVYWGVGGSTTVHLEAATATDLDTLAPADVLTINGTAYTVATVPAAATSISDRTVIGGATTTTRYYRRITLTASLSANGRVYPAGIAFRNHPNLTFAPGVAAADGGRGNGGSARLLGFSGDSNGALIFADGAQTLSVIGPKSEANNSLVHISGTANGGGRGRVDVSGYRADGFGTFDGGMIRITGTARPSVVVGTGQLVSYTYILNDQTPTSGAEQITAASFYGQGFLHYCRDGTEIAYFTEMRASSLTVGDLGATAPTLKIVDGSDAANRKWTWRVGNATDIYRMGVGSTLADVFTVGSNTGNSAYLWAYNGTNTEKLMKFYSESNIAAVQIGLSAAQKVGLYGATPVVQRAGAAQAAVSDTAGGTYTAAEQSMLSNLKTLTNELRTALVDLGVIKGSA